MGIPLLGIIISGFLELNYIKLRNLFPTYKNFIVQKESNAGFQIAVI